MYKGLVDNLAFMYGFITRGRGKIAEDDMRKMATGAHVMVKNAPAVLGGEDQRPEDLADLKEAQKMDEHIEEMVIFLMSLEIV
jgi:hypothetical protein